MLVFTAATHLHRLVYVPTLRLRYLATSYCHPSHAHLTRSSIKSSRLYILGPSCRNVWFCFYARYHLGVSAGLALMPSLPPGTRCLHPGSFRRILLASLVDEGFLRETEVEVLNS